MAASEAPLPVRIAKIAGRFLVFEPDAAAALRRHANMNGVLVGTAPQQPTQNIFMGLPVELRPEEVSALVQTGAAYVVDAAAAHAASLEDPSARKAYVKALQDQKQIARDVLYERAVEKAADVAELVKKSRAKSKKPAKEVVDAAPPPVPEIKHLAVTPTASTDLLPQSTTAQHTNNEVPDGPLCRHLHAAGYHMTPGLRFGSDYSVYPGDPLRFHAHFMANQYGWDEEVPVLDLVGGGRLATAVKKAFLVGGEQPATADAPATVRTFSIEWAAM